MLCNSVSELWFYSFMIFFILDFPIRGSDYKLFVYVVCIYADVASYVYAVMTN